MMKFRTPAFALSLVAIFSISFLIQWKRLNPGGPPPSGPEIPAIVAARTPPPPPLPRGTGIAADNNFGSRQGVTAPASQRAESTPADSNAASADELPIEIHFRKRPDRGRIQGSVANRSESEMIIDAIVFDPNTKGTSSVQLIVGPYSAKPFGLDDGLDIQPGDRITLRSAPFRDKAVQIP
jgi:hypothetical protein